jgi:hypothetical protein
VSIERKAYFSKLAVLYKVGSKVLAVEEWESPSHLPDLELEECDGVCVCVKVRMRAEPHTYLHRAQRGKGEGENIHTQ